MGFGLQLFLNPNSKFQPTAELTADAYLEDDKVLRLNSDGTPMDDVGGMINFFVGASYHPVKTVYFSLAGGPSFISGKALLGIKPSAGLYFSESKRWTGKISYINVFNRDEATKQSFGSISFSVGVRLF